MLSTSGSLSSLVALEYRVTGVLGLQGEETYGRPSVINPSTTDTQSVRHPTYNPRECNAMPDTDGAFYD